MKLFTPSSAITRKLLAAVPGSARQRPTGATEIPPALTPRLGPQRRVARRMSVADGKIEPLTRVAQHPPLRAREVDRAEVAERLALYLSTLADRAQASGRPVELASVRGLDPRLLRELQARLGLPGSGQAAVGELVQAYCDWVRDTQRGHYEAPWGSVDVKDGLVTVSARNANLELPVPRLDEVARPMMGAGRASPVLADAPRARASHPLAHGRRSGVSARRHA